MPTWMVAGREHPDRHRPTEGIKQWMAPAVDAQPKKTLSHPISSDNTIPVTLPQKLAILG